MDISLLQGDLIWQGDWQLHLCFRWIPSTHRTTQKEDGWQPETVLLRTLL